MKTNIVLIPVAIAYSIDGGSALTKGTINLPRIPTVGEHIEVADGKFHEVITVIFHVGKGNPLATLVLDRDPTIIFLTPDE